MDAATTPQHSHWTIDSLDAKSKSLFAQCTDCFSKEAISLQSSPQKLVNWIEKGQSGQFMFVVSTACPAYSYEHLPGEVPRYTYQGLNYDIGLSGKRLFKSLNGFHSLLRNVLQVKHFNHQVLVADFDGFNNLTAKRVGVNTKQFFERTLSTACAYNRDSRGRISPQTFSEICADKEQWRAELDSISRRAYGGEFAHLLDKALLHGIGADRQPMFEAFAGEQIGNGRWLELLVMRRAIEFATAGKLICGRFPDALILTVSDGGLSQFYGLATDAPVLNLDGFE